MLGLTEGEAASRQRADGPNALPASSSRGAWPRQLLAQFVNFFALLLWFAALLAVVAGMVQLGVAIAIVVVVNGGFAFAQQARAERTAAALGQLLPRRVVVVRGGRDREIDATELVRGDLVRLAAGVRVSADLEVRHSDGLLLDTSMLTGETVPGSLDEGDAAPAGSFVVSGSGTGEVTAIGANTCLASIAALTQQRPHPRTPLALELDRVVRRIGAIAVVTGVAFFGIALLLGTSPRSGFLFAVGVTVALVPEGLLPTITLSLAVGAQRMAAHHALVRRLDAVETLGSTTIICSDKTGTLTRNEMSVVEVWTPRGGATVHGAGYEPSGAVTPRHGAGRAVADVAAAGRACSDGRIRLDDGLWHAVGDPMEAAIDAFAHRCHVAEDVEVLATLAFDSHRRRMSTVVRRDDGLQLCTKGGPEAVLGICAANDAAYKEAELLAARGLRVLAIARRSISEDELAEVHADHGTSLEEGMELLGLMAFEDPPRDGIPAAIARCRELGVGIIMITGDHPITAQAIAVKIGLAQDAATVLTGDDLPDDTGALGALIDHDGLVISRVSPEQKLQIALALQARGHVVAMTGDGVNDGPALQTADVGVAMGRSGTDVAREAADVVLLDDDFSTIVMAIEQGRTVYGNIRRFLTYHLTDNVAELTPFLVWALSGGRIPLAISVLQVLSLDIGTDLLPALALGIEPPHRGAQPIAEGRLLDRKVLARSFGWLGPTEALMEMSAFFVALMAAGWRPGMSFPTGHALAVASGAAFSAVVLGQLANAFACRGDRSPAWRVDAPRNTALIGATLVEFALLFGFLGVGPVARLLGQTWPGFAGGAVAVATIPAVLLADATAKRISRRTLSASE